MIKYYILIGFLPKLGFNSAYVKISIIFKDIKLLPVPIIFRH